MAGQQPFVPKAHPPLAEELTNISYQVYVLRSLSDGVRYIGSGESVAERLRRHNKGDYQFTKGHRPWEIIYIEDYLTRAESMRREKFLKSGQGRKWLDEKEFK